MATRVPVTLVPPRGSDAKKQTGTLWLAAEFLRLEYKPRFSFRAKVSEYQIPFEGIKSATYDTGFLNDKIIVVVRDKASLDSLITADLDKARFILEVDKDERDHARSLVRQIQLDRMGDIFEEMLEITDLNPDPDL